MVWSEPGDIIVPPNAQPTDDFIDLTTNIPAELQGVLSTGIIINNGRYNGGSSGASIKYWFLGPFTDPFSGTKQLVLGMVTTQGTLTKYTKILSADVDSSNTLISTVSGVKAGDTGDINLTLVNGFGGFVHQRVINGVSYVNFSITSVAGWAASSQVVTLPYPPSEDFWDGCTLYGNVYCPIHVDTTGKMVLQVAGGANNGALGAFSFPV